MVRNLQIQKKYLAQSPHDDLAFSFWAAIISNLTFRILTWCSPFMTLKVPGIENDQLQTETKSFHARMLIETTYVLLIEDP